MGRGGGGEGGSGGWRGGAPRLMSPLGHPPAPTPATDASDVPGIGTPPPPAPQQGERTSTSVGIGDANRTIHICVGCGSGHERQLVSLRMEIVSLKTNICITPED